jgi:hypothetical protein
MAGVDAEKEIGEVGKNMLNMRLNRRMPFLHSVMTTTCSQKIVASPILPEAL